MRKLFTNDKFFLIAVILSAISLLTLAIHYLVGNSAGLIRQGLFYLALAICSIVLYISYRNHEKNVMKGVIGALLMGILFSCISGLGVSNNTVFAIIGVVIAAILMLNHFLINMGRISNPIHIRFSQILAFVFCIYSIVYAIIRLPSEPLPIDIADTVFSIIACIGMVLTIVCIESRLDAYRIDRELAGWTKKQGYPEEYVHEYQKDNKSNKEN